MINFGNRNRNRRSNRRQKGAAQQGPLLQAVREMSKGINRLTVVTQDKSPPVRPDINPMMISSRQKVYTFQRSINGGILTATNLPTLGAYSFTLGTLPSYTDFTSLFDQYRIIQVQIKFTPLLAANGFGPATTSTTLPTLYTAIDYDDSTTPAAVDDLRQYDTLEVSPYNVYTQRTFQPRAALALYSGVFTSFGQTSPGQWIDAGSPNVQYYGLKYAITPVTVASGAYPIFQVDANIILQCRNTQ